MLFRTYEHLIIIIHISVSSLLNKLKSQAREQMETRRPNLVKALQKMGDFYMELKWDFQSWGRSNGYCCNIRRICSADGAL